MDNRKFLLSASIALFNKEAPIDKDGKAITQKEWLASMPAERAARIRAIAFHHKLKETPLASPLTLAQLNALTDFFSNGVYANDSSLRQAIEGYAEKGASSKDGEKADPKLLEKEADI